MALILDNQPTAEMGDYPDKRYLRRRYSVHYGLIHKTLDVRVTASTVEIWHQGRRIASHARIYQKGRHQSQDAHQPPSQKKYLEWTPERILAWGRKSGPLTEVLMGKVMECRRHQEQGYRSCLGILRLGQKYSPERLENACLRAVLAQKACRDGYPALYFRLYRLLEKMALAKADGSYGKRLQKPARFHLLILDDWGLNPLKDGDRRDLPEILKDQHDISSTIITSIWVSILISGCVATLISFFWLRSSLRRNLRETS